MEERKAAVYGLFDALKAYMALKYKIVTFGCQMNLADSGILASVLERHGHRAVKSEKEADLIILNTCSVRKKAETRVFGRLSELSRLKKEDGRKKIAVVGCMAQRLAGRLPSLVPYVDIILGPDRLFDLPAYLENGSERPLVRTEFGCEFDPDILPVRENRYAAFITISRGCDNYCTYCIVPYVRGPERNIAVSSILKRVRSLVDDGAVEITFLGQNVNAYHDGSINFPQLLARVAHETEVKRIRFMTSHPRDMSEELIELIGQEPKMMPHVHLPLQSGSDRILQRMGRNYTSEHYLSLIKKLRQAAPDIAITTDLIVGFPSESEKEYEMTLEAVRTVQFDSSFMFRYSPREGTGAADYEDDVPEEEKIRRLKKLIHLQKEIAFKKNQEEVGKIRSVLVDGVSRRNVAELKGKTGRNKTILFKADQGHIGAIKSVEVTSADSWTLHGKLMERE